MSKIKDQQCTEIFTTVSNTFKHKDLKNLGWPTIQEEKWNSLVQQETADIQRILNQSLPPLLQKRKKDMVLKVCILCVLAAGISALYYYFH